MLSGLARTHGLIEMRLWIGRELMIGELNRDSCADRELAEARLKRIHPLFRGELMRLEMMPELLEESVDAGEPRFERLDVSADIGAIAGDDIGRLLDDLTKLGDLLGRASILGRELFALVHDLRLELADPLLVFSQLCLDQLSASLGIEAAAE